MYVLGEGKDTTVGLSSFGITACNGMNSSDAMDSINTSMGSLSITGNSVVIIDSVSLTQDSGTGSVVEVPVSGGNSVVASIDYVDLSSTQDSATGDSVVEAVLGSNSVEGSLHPLWLTRASGTVSSNEEEAVGGISVVASIDFVDLSSTQDSATGDSVAEAVLGSNSVEGSLHPLWLTRASGTGSSNDDSMLDGNTGADSTQSETSDSI